MSGPGHVIVGVDPGKTGAIVALTGGDIVEATRFPLIGAGSKQRIDMVAVTDLLRRYAAWPGGCLVAMEDVHSMATDSPRSAWTFSAATHIVLGAVLALEVPFVQVAPKDWQSTMLRGHKRGGADKAARRKAIKESSRLVASQRWPILAERLRVKANDGIADAALIAEHARRVWVSDARA